MDPRSLEASHVAGWASLWESGVEVRGNSTVAATINVTFYAILSSLREDTALGCSPSGLARNNYEGHAFWDCDTWILPSIVLQWPGIAESMTRYRYDRLRPAQERAKARGLAGAMWPWESAYTGYDMCGPGQTEGTNEIHISGDIPMSFRLHYLVSRNDSWLRTHAWPVVRNSADFFASRAVREPVSGNYTQKQVVTPDEGAGIVDDAAYTNAIAARTLQFACLIAERLNLTTTHHGRGVGVGGHAAADDDDDGDGDAEQQQQQRLTATSTPGYLTWRKQAARPYLPLSSSLDPRGAIHPEFTNYTGAPIAQSSVALMQYPLGWQMPVDVARRDLAYYQVRSSGMSTAGFFTGDSSYSIAWLRAGNRTEADAQFAQAFVHLDLAGFGVWMEKYYSHGDGGALNEISSGGAFLQNVLYGYAGVSIETEGITFEPAFLSHQHQHQHQHQQEAEAEAEVEELGLDRVLPMGMSGMTLRGIAFAGYRIRYEFDARQMSLEVTRQPPVAAATAAVTKLGDSQRRRAEAEADAATRRRLCVTDAAGGTHALDLKQGPLLLPLQRALLHLAAL
jgi:trehalose/maltose hydrolase-like predicted phosphorylase